MGVSDILLFKMGVLYSFVYKHFELNNNFLGQIVIETFRTVKVYGNYSTLNFGYLSWLNNRKHLL